MRWAGGPAHLTSVCWFLVQQLFDWRFFVSMLTVWVDRVLTFNNTLQNLVATGQASSPPCTNAGIHHRTNA
jgi:hypothetical protein